MSAQTFRLLNRDQIDIGKWNEAVAASSSPIYHYSWFLDAMKTKWLGLVAVGESGNYISTTPLQTRKYFGITFICQNPFFPCHTVPKTHHDEGAAFQLFVKRALQNFAYVQKLIYRYQHFPTLTDYQQKMVLNYRLDIKTEFAQNLKRFSMNRKRDLRTALKNNLTFFENTEIDTYIQFHEAFLSRKIPGFEIRQYQELRSLLAAAQQRSKAVIAWVCQNHNPVAAAILLFEKDTITYFSAAASHLGRKLGAATFLISEVLRKYSGVYNDFDFNGGWDVASLNRFYAGFGATPEQLIIANRVAFPEPFRTLFLIRAKVISALQNLNFRVRRSIQLRLLNIRPSSPSS